MLHQRGRFLLSMAPIAIVLLFASVATAQLRAGGIESISPAKGRTGDTVTIQGHGFGARNVSVTVGGVPAQILETTGFSVTFRVPDGVKPGLTQVVAVNPGFQSGSIQFRILEGILLPGTPTALAKDTTLDLLAPGVGPDQILNTIVLTRIGVRFSSDATVAQVNNLLQQIDGGIVGMSHGLTFMTIAIPRQDLVASIDALIALADGMPGVSFAIRAQVLQNDQIFVPTADVSTDIRHLLPSRFPAAWNALPPGFGSTPGICPTSIIPFLIADNFGPVPPGFNDAMPGVPLPAPPPAGTLDQHGYFVALVAAANGVGANPFVTLNCLDVRLVQLGGTTVTSQVDNLVAAMPAGLGAGEKFIVNFSQGFVGLCQGTPNTDCVPPQRKLPRQVDTA